MKRRYLIGCLGAALLVACQRAAENQDAAPAAPPALDPAETVRPLYERYVVANAQFPPLLEQAPWSATMRAALGAMMARSEAAQTPILDFDPFINAQDYQLSNVVVSSDGYVAQSHGVVRVRFLNAGAADEVVFDMVWEGDAWKVDNIRHEGWDLRQIAVQP